MKTDFAFERFMSAVLRNNVLRFAKARARRSGQVQFTKKERP